MLATESRSKEVLTKPLTRTHARDVTLHRHNAGAPRAFTTPTLSPDMLLLRRLRMYRLLMVGAALDDFVGSW